MQFWSNRYGRGAEYDAASTRRHRRGSMLACIVVAGGLATAAHGGAQGNPDRSIHDPLPPAPPDANAQMVMREQQAKTQNYAAANAERKKQIADDSERLLKMATDLKAEVDKTNKDTLSLNVIRKAGEIEKLAHNVKEKMKLTEGAN